VESPCTHSQLPTPWVLASPRRFEESFTGTLVGAGHHLGAGDAASQVAAHAGAAVELQNGGAGGAPERPVAAGDCAAGSGLQALLNAASAGNGCRPVLFGDGRGARWARGAMGVGRRLTRGGVRRHAPKGRQMYVPGGGPPAKAKLKRARKAANVLFKDVSAAPRARARGAAGPSAAAGRAARAHHPSERTARVC
jgi:hypothetical protein